MKRNSFILIVSLLIGLLTVPAFAGDLAKPSTSRGNIITGSEVSDLYDLVKGTTEFSGISINGVDFSDSGFVHADTLTADSIVVENLTVSGTVNGVKVYRALLSQSGTDAPVAVVLENTLGGAVVWSYVSPGQYNGTLVGAFPDGKTNIQQRRYYPQDSIATMWDAGVSVRRLSDNIVDVYGYEEDTLTNGAVVDFFIEVLVYP